MDSQIFYFISVKLKKKLRKKFRVILTSKHNNKVNDLLRIWSFLLFLYDKRKLESISRYKLILSHSCLGSGGRSMKSSLLLQCPMLGELFNSPNSIQNISIFIHSAILFEFSSGGKGRVEQQVVSSKSPWNSDLFIFKVRRQCAKDHVGAKGKKPEKD